jgi:uncharacterized protein (DUF1330 family)
VPSIARAKIETTFGWFGASSLGSSTTTVRSCCGTSRSSAASRVVLPGPFTPWPCRGRVVKAYSPAMPAYVIVETDITDAERYEQYKAASPGAIAAGGGRFVARGGELAVLEGDWQPSRLVVLEFEDLATAKRWYHSDVYQQAKKLREGAARLRVVAVQGVD